MRARGCLIQNSIFKRFLAYARLIFIRFKNDFHYHSMNVYDLPEMRLWMAQTRWRILPYLCKRIDKKITWPNVSRSGFKTFDSDGVWFEKIMGSGFGNYKYRQPTHALGNGWIEVRTLIIREVGGISRIRKEWGLKCFLEIITSLKILQGVVVGSSQYTKFHKIKYDISKIPALSNIPMIH